MAALLDIVKLNEYDRAQKIKNALKVQEMTNNNKPEIEPSPKRLKTLDDQR